MVDMPSVTESIFGHWKLAFVKICSMQIKGLYIMDPKIKNVPKMKELF
jgi:hypothetical protein